MVDHMIKASGGIGSSEKEKADRPCPSKAVVRLSNHGCPWMESSSLVKPFMVNLY